MAEQRGAAAGLCKALPQPKKSQHFYRSSKHLRDSQSLLARGLAIHSVVLLPQDTPHMAGCYGQPPPHPLLECLCARVERRGEDRVEEEEEKEE